MSAHVLIMCATVWIQCLTKEACYLFHCALNALAAEALLEEKLLWKIRPKLHRFLGCIIHPLCFTPQLLPRISFVIPTPYLLKFQGGYLQTFLEIISVPTPHPFSFWRFSISATFQNFSDLMEGVEARWGELRYHTAGGSTTRLRVAQPGSNNVAFSVQVALSRGQLRYHTAGGSTTRPQISVSEMGNIGNSRLQRVLFSQ